MSDVYTSKLNATYILHSNGQGGKLQITDCDVDSSIGL